jgi:hypothetical protein
LPNPATGTGRPIHGHPATRTPIRGQRSAAPFVMKAVEGVEVPR